MDDPFGFSGPVEIIAHRGYSARAPENTVAALTAGVKAGADAVEFDLHSASDGTPVVFHDATLERTTDGSGPVASLDPAALAGLDAGSWFDPAFAGEPVPTVAQAVASLHGWAGRFYPEIKGYLDPADLNRLVDLFRDAGALDRAVFISMDWAALDLVREAEPEARVGYIVEHVDRAEAALERASGDPRAMIDFDQRILLAHPDRARAALDAGVALACWTVNDVETAARLLELGVPRITTNEVSKLVAWRDAA